MFKAVAASIVMVCVVAGCQTREQFRAAAEPIAIVMRDDLVRYSNLQSDAAIKAEDQDVVSRFVDAVHGGVADDVAGVWFGVGNMRWRLERYMASDPRFEQPGGVEFKTQKVNTMSLFDYIVALGRQN